MAAMIEALPLQQLDYVPEALLTAKPEQLHDSFPHPTLFHLKGKQTQPIFVSVMLHGNEPTGFLALQTLLKKYQQQTLPRSLSFFLGNTLAAKEKMRRLPEQPDYNRVWPGTEQAQSPESLMMKNIIANMQQRQILLSVDIHNNTGLNPHYACVNKLDDPFLQLASLFSRLVVYFTRPKGVQSAALAELCPAVTLECGQPGQHYGVDHAVQFLETCLTIDHLPDRPVAPRDIDVFRTVAQVTVKKDCRFSFNDDSVDLLLSRELEKLNFTEVATGTIFGKVANLNELPLIALDQSGTNRTDDFFDLESNHLIFKKKAMPSMLTLNETIIRQDCLCYLMERT
ncbi:MAG: M14 family metallopeptidase [Methylococcaceae bacterium]